MMPVTGAETVRWNLADLYPDAEALRAALAAALGEADAFAARYRGQIAALDAARTPDDVLAVLGDVSA